MSGFEETLLVVASIGSVAAAAGAWFHERRSSATQLSAVKQKLDLVLDHLGIATPGESEVIHHLENGRTIEAVRAYRTQTGVSLLEAKQAVDRIAAGQGPTGQ